MVPVSSPSLTAWVPPRACWAAAPLLRLEGGEAEGEGEAEVLRFLDIVVCVGGVWWLVLLVFESNDVDVLLVIDGGGG